MAVLNLLDIQKMNQGDLVPMIESSLEYAPEVGIIPAYTVPGAEFYTLERTALPTTGFRAANEGITPSKSSYATRLHEAFIVGGAVQFDTALANKLKKGMADLERDFAQSVMASAMVTIGKQIWYGTSQDAKGFGGLKSFCATTDAQAYDATGTTAGAASSVYAVRLGPDGVQLVFGNGGGFALDPFANQSLFDTSGNQYPGRVSNLAAWVGLEIASKYAVGRIWDLTEETGKMLTDAMLGILVDKFPLSYRPNAIFMNKRSRRQLQNSRTVTVNTNGNTKIGGASYGVAATPTEFEGIPIYVTDCIGVTDTIGT